MITNGHYGTDQLLDILDGQHTDVTGATAFAHTGAGYSAGDIVSVMSGSITKYWRAIRDIAMPDALGANAPSAPDANWADYAGPTPIDFDPLGNYRTGDITRTGSTGSYRFWQALRDANGRGQLGALYDPAVSSIWREVLAYSATGSYVTGQAIIGASNEFYVAKKELHGSIPTADRPGGANDTWEEIVDLVNNGIDTNHLLVQLILDTRALREALIIQQGWPQMVKDSNKVAGE